VAGTVQAEQQGVWSVGVDGPVLAQQDGEWSIAQRPGAPAEPFQSTVTLEMDTGQLQDFQSLVVPPGRRLVIEHVSAHAALPNGQAVFQLRLDVAEAAGGALLSHFLVLEPQGSRLGIGDYFAASQAVRLYAVGSARAAAFRTADAGFGFVELTISGFVVDP
jgi:hypothetical protein